MNLKILICDDDKIFTQKLKKDISTFFSNHKEKILIDIKTTQFNSLTDINYDIVFTDIDLALKSINGVSLAMYIKDKIPNCIIIFVSVREDLVFETFKVDTFQFIRKKYYNLDFNTSMNQLYEHLNKYKKMAVLNINGRITKIYINNIKYIISIGNDTIISCRDTDITFRSTLKNTLKLLNCNNLIQIQRTLAVNLNYIDDFVKWKIICGNKEYKIGRIYQKEFLNVYENYLLTSYVNI